MEKEKKTKIIGNIRIMDDNDVLYRLGNIEFIGNNEDEVYQDIENYLIYKLSDYLGIDEKEIREDNMKYEDKGYISITYHKNTCKYCPDKNNCEYLKNDNYCEYSHIPYTIEFYEEELV